ncbi:cytochrome c [Vineibacter terrae]|uniref:cytochrome c n=1 Tax=Vineibacter terrae TaxID=2586908 RepID=UPI002E34BFFE|nr:cytochrome c [Vineibacter terrae]HEX2890011.1 cytochrome c [Vineibacter terrae]
MSTVYRAALIGIGFLLVAATASRADEFAIKLKPGPGAEVTQTQCAACHSLDYIQMNSPFPKRAVWEAEVNKMINAFGAMIEAEDAKTIIDYLAKNYGS